MIFTAWGVNNSFDPTSAFSNVRLHLKPIFVDEQKLPVRFPALFKEIEVPMLHTFLSKQFIVRASGNSDPTELDVMLQLAKDVYRPLFGNQSIIFANRNSKRIEAAGFSSADIGLGSKQTFHGTPDLRLFESFQIQSMPCDLADDGGCDDDCAIEHVRSSRSSVSSLDGEGKREKNHVDQAAAICIISSITQHNLNSTRNSLVPSLLINKRAFLVLLYDAEHDVLLISNEIALIDGNKFFLTNAVSLLYHVVYHRSTLRNLSAVLNCDRIKRYNSRFKSYCSPICLQNLSALKSMNVPLQSFQESKEEKEKRKEEEIFFNETELKVADEIYDRIQDSEEDTLHSHTHT